MPFGLRCDALYYPCSRSLDPMQEVLAAKFSGSGGNTALKMCSKEVLGVSQVAEVSSPPAGSGDFDLLRAEGGDAASPSSGVSPESRAARALGINVSCVLSL